MRRIRRDGHAIAYTVAGDVGAQPIVVVHGGPGSGSHPGMLAPFGGLAVCAVSVDQRGAGASLPRGRLRHNRTDRLVADLEAVRRALGFEQWHVAGGSWGAALALAYAGTHPERVSGIVLRGLFLTSRREVRSLFVTSRSRAPREWLRLSRAAGGGRPSMLFERCAKRLAAGAPHACSLAVARAWRDYEAAVLASAHWPRGRPVARRPRATDEALVAKYRIQAHYLRHDCWLGERRLLALAREVERAGIPAYAIHGLRDPVCPPGNVQRLARAIPGVRAEFANAGHLASKPALGRALARTVETMLNASLLDDKAWPVTKPREP
ncbi:alpha/beta fold hydrolase [Trinickia acidisoli]|uniref:alpha/beta fold hydrolase n=1 Tax=Trinickia acidisoli TaxID=2767482 RepID=UPI001A90C093|nr:alpha/beta fold hydrolase [Trinickia acidisoli]